MGANDITYGIRLNADSAGLATAFAQGEAAAGRLAAATTKAGAATTAAMSQAEQSARKLVESSSQGSAATTAALGRIENSAKQTAQAMRQLPMQMTDIVTGLASGQTPFMVLMQQGGQLKDSFGGIVPAAKAVAGQVLSVTGAAVAGAAAIGALAYAFAQGREESIRFAESMRVTGGYAGVTEAQFNALASTLSGRVKTSAGVAREALEAAVASGSLQGKNLELAGEAALRMSKATEQSAQNVLQSFDSMRNGVAKWAAENNQQFHFMSLAQYEQVKSLEESGRAQEAMGVVLTALNAHLASQERQLGTLERAWKSIKGAVSDAAEGWRSLGREATDADRLAEAYKKLADAKKYAQMMGGGQGSDRMLEEAYANVDRVLSEKIKKENDAAKAAADKRVQEEGISAARELDIAQRKYDKKKAMAEELAAYERNVSRVQAAGGTAPSDAEQARAKAAIREQYRDKSGDSAAKEAANQKYRAELAAQEGLQAREADALRAHLSQLDALRQQGVLSEEAVIQRRLQLQQEALDKQIASAEAQAAIARGKGKAGDAEKYDQDAERLRAQRAEAETQSETQLTTLQMRRTAALQDWIQGQKDALDQQQFEASLVGKTNDEVERLTRARQIDLSIRNATRSSDGSLKVDEATEAGYKSYGDSLKSQQDPRTAWKQGDWTEGATQGMREYAAQAKTAAETSRDAFVAMADKSGSALASFVTTGKFNFKDFARSLLSDLAQIYAKQLIVWAIKSATGYSSGGTVDGATTASAKGNVFGAGGLQPFALGGEFGGVLDRPTFFAFAQGGQAARGLAGESGTEGIFPLQRTRDGRLGVVGTGGGGTVVNVFAAEGTKASTRERQEGNQTIVDVLFERMDEVLAGGVSSGNGALTTALEQTYGLNRAASGR